MESSSIPLHENSVTPISPKTSNLFVQVFHCGSVSDRCIWRGGRLVMMLNQSAVQSHFCPVDSKASPVTLAVIWGCRLWADTHNPEGDKTDIEESVFLSETKSSAYSFCASSANPWSAILIHWRVTDINALIDFLTCTMPVEAAGVHLIIQHKESFF